MPAARRYAAETKVPISSSKAEIENTLRRYGATGFGYVTNGRRAQVMFEAHGRRIRFDLPDPRDSAPYKPSTTAHQRAIDQEERRLWRSLALAVKSKLDIVESGISTFETEFLPYTVLEGGRTFAEAANDTTFREALTTSAPLALGSGDRV